MSSRETARAGVASPIACHAISTQAFFDLLATLSETLPVIGPRERQDQPGFHHFGPIRRPEDLALDYVTTTLPPKDCFFQPSEPIYTFTLSHPPQLKLISDVARFVLVGIHPCDLRGLHALDEAYATPPAEARWLADRKLATVIGMDCKPDEYCFCTSVNAWDSREACDLFLTPVDHGFLVEVYTASGQDLLANAELRDASQEDMDQAGQWRDDKKRAMQAKLCASVHEFADILEAGGLTPIWKETAERCYSCGSCNITCPACFCFDMHDEFDLSLKSGSRRRTWDSCQLLDFALVAGRHNFRGERWQRVRHRWHRKFLYLYKRSGHPYCTGCGRCSRACAADINIVDVSNRLIEQGRKESVHA